MVDNLPNKDKKYTKNIVSVMDKITAKLLEDFEKSKIFKNIHLGVKSDDDIIINGTVNRFFWKYRQNPKTNIPFAGPFISPFWFTNAIADISLEIKDNKTGAIIGILQESSELEGNYGMWDNAYLDGVNAQTELASAFKDVANKLKKNILTKFNSPVIVSNAGEILKYKKLLDSGAITKEEYEQKKKQLLNL